MRTTDGSIELSTLFVLLVGIAIKHYVADFLLQTSWMARGKECARGWAGPLVAHAGTHGSLTFVIALAVRPELWWLGLVDFIAHGVIDRGKAATSLRLKLEVSDARFWWLMGFDQLLHQLTNVGLVAAIVLA